MALEDTMLFKQFKAQASVPDPLADKVAAQVAFDEVLEPMGIRAPGPEPHESDGHYLARLGEHAAAFGPEDRKGVNRHSLPSAALAEFVRQDLEIARQEADTPNYSLKPGVPQTRQKADASGREFTYFYSADGPKFWMDTFKEPVTRYVSGGSRGILTTDHQRPSSYNFNKSQVLPEIHELQRRASYADSAEGRIEKLYREAGKEIPETLRKQLRG